MQNTPSAKSILISYFSYLMLFIGTAFVSGAIVHTGNIADLYKYLVIGFIGLLLFTIGSYLQEYIINKDSSHQGKISFLLFSLILSVGIGMVSGGTQHYSDFPLYSSVLIPLGLVISYFAFLLKNNFKFTKLLLTIGGIIVLFTAPLYLGLQTLAVNLINNKCNTVGNFGSVKIHASQGHDDCDPVSKNSNTKTNLAPSMTMNMKINDDKTFIEYVIPHHQDAVDGSQTVLKTTQDPELKLFLENVIKTQSSEITTLKGYYKTWFGTEYKDNSNYQKMMKLDGLTGVAIDKAYIQGMLGHHSGIIDVAKMVLTDSKYQYKPEILELSKQIIKDQEADNAILNQWLETKYKNLQTSVTDDVHSGH